MLTDSPKCLGLKDIAVAHVKDSSDTDLTKPAFESAVRVAQEIREGAKDVGADTDKDELAYFTRRALLYSTYR